MNNNKNMKLGKEDCFILDCETYEKAHECIELFRAQGYKIRDKWNDSIKTYKIGLHIIYNYPNNGGIAIHNHGTATHTYKDVKNFFSTTTNQVVVAECLPDIEDYAVGDVWYNGSSGETFVSVGATWLPVGEVTASAGFSNPYDTITLTSDSGVSGVIDLSPVEGNDGSGILPTIKAPDKKIENYVPNVCSTEKIVLPLQNIGGGKVYVPTININKITY